MTLAIGLLTAAVAAGGEVEVVHALMDPGGLPALHDMTGDAEPVMRLPQFRLFDAEGRSLWSFDRMPSRKEFRRALAERLESRQTLSDEPAFRREARYFLRRGGLPLNLTTLPQRQLTVVEYWADGCGACRVLAAEVDRFFARADDVSVLVIRVYIDLGPRPD